MKVLSLGLDSNIFESDSRTRVRAIEYGSLVDELHIILYTLKKHNLPKEKQQISRNVFVYPTDLKWRFLYPFVVFWFCLDLTKKLGLNKNNSLITSQEAMTNIPSIWLSWWTGIPLQIQIHTDFLSPYYSIGFFRTWLQKLGYKMGLKRAKCVRVVSKRIEKSLVEILHVNLSKIVVLAIRPELEIFEQNDQRDYLHKKFPQYNFIILMVSRLEAEKDYPLALGAFRDIVAKHPRAGLIIVGDGGGKTKIKKLISRYKLDANVVIDEWMEGGKLAAYYRSADIYLLTSRFEGYGMSLVEAAASGCPIVTTDVGLVGDVLTRESASVVPVGSRRAIVSAIDRMIKVRDLRVMLAERAKREIAKLPSKEEYLADYKASWLTCLS